MPFDPKDFKSIHQTQLEVLRSIHAHLENLNANIRLGLQALTERLSRIETLLQVLAESEGQK